MKWARQLPSTPPLTINNIKELALMNTEINIKFDIDKTSVRILIVVAALVLLFLSVRSITAQEVSDTIRINTRVVFMDALVKDKRTGVPISDLKPENFQVYDDGNVRPITYFTREGQTRKPLAIVLVLDLRDDGAGRFLKRPEIRKAMADELAKLSPQDELAILAMSVNGEDEVRVWLSGFTREPNQIVAALDRAAKYIDVEPEEADAVAAKANHLNNESEPNSSAGPGPGKPKSEDPVEVEVTKGKNGSVVTRTVNLKDGSVDVKRVDKKGEVQVEVDGIYDLAAAVKDSARKAQQERPNSQTAIIYLSDGINPIFIEDRDRTEQYVLRSNIIFNAMTVELRTLFKLLMPIGKPLAGMLGVSIYGASKRLAQQSGGEAIKIKRTKDYAAAINRIIGNLTARYSLGFALAEDEKDDGHLHSLEVRVKAQDAKGKTRKLEVSSRQGYYLTEKSQ
jgi:VWFA-related protein